MERRHHIPITIHRAVLLGRRDAEANITQRPEHYRAKQDSAWADWYREGYDSEEDTDVIAMAIHIRIHST